MMKGLAWLGVLTGQPSQARNLWRRSSMWSLTLRSQSSCDLTTWCLCWPRRTQAIPRLGMINTITTLSNQQMRLMELKRQMLKVLATNATKSKFQSNLMNRPKKTMQLSTSIPSSSKSMRGSSLRNFTKSWHRGFTKPRRTWFQSTRTWTSVIAL